MLLVIPSMDIRDQKCFRSIQGLPGSEAVYSDDPVETAKLWRRENSKCLHVVDLDGAKQGQLKNIETIRQIVQSVDIPIQLGGRLSSSEDITMALVELGVYRVVLSGEAEVSLIRRLIDEHGPPKIVVSIEAKDGIVRARGRNKGAHLTASSLALKMKEIGVSRIVYTDVMNGDALNGPNFEAIRLFAEKTGLRITAAGGVRGLEDLLKLQELEPFGVDSVIIGRALYENRFSCQGLWRTVEAEESKAPRR
ncbi:MAG: 1-(5-phosphoribosyl)-5-[(5-phosphoribosylamino)methylideneamino] imidazole-4-carboxamide isomerase [Bacteroidota bacterium]